MSGAPLITMREAKFNSNSRFKTLSDEDLFADEVEPLNSILSKFKYWPRNGNKIYTKKCMLFCGFLLFNIGFLLSFLIFGRVNLSFRYHTFSNNKTISIRDVLGIFQRSEIFYRIDFNVSSGKTNYTSYEETVLLKQHFETYRFDEISPIITSNVLLSFKNKQKPDALEIIIDKGEIHYRNVRNATYSYVIPNDAKEIRNVTNNVSGLPVYGNFGSEDDLNFLSEKGISLRGCIILLRLGKIPIFKKVTNALKRGANGVLLFADPQQYPNVDLLSVSEEISPTLLANLQKTYGSLEMQQSTRAGVPVQIIEAMTAQNILREMAATNKAPNSWKGALDALYSIGPGFVFHSGRLVLYSYFLNVNYTTYDIAGYIRGNREPDRYVIVGSKRKSLNNNEKNFYSTNALMEVSKTLAELKIEEGWNPSRTIVFCSFGLEEAENYSEDSWVQRYKHIIKQRAVAYLDMKQPIQGLEYLNVEMNPLLESIFENVSSLVENPNAEEKLTEKKTLFDVWHHQQKWQNSTSDKNITRLKFVPGNYESGMKMVENELLSPFSLPTIAFGYDTQEENHSTNTNTNSIVNIYEYENAIVKLWTLLTFSLSDNVILPFNISAYSTILNHFYEKLYRENEHLQNTSVADDLKHFGESVENLSTQIKNFHNNAQIVDDKKPLEIRMLNDKIMQIDRLIKCNDDDKVLISSSQDPVFISLQESLSETSLNSYELKVSLKKTINCMDEIIFLMNVKS